MVIGLDEAENLAASIASLRGQGLSREEVEVIYVDSGSRDGSIAIGLEAGADRVLTLPRGAANAARARNLGLEKVAAPFVQFVDGDTRLEPGWARTALGALESDPTLVAVEGTLREAYPSASLYDAVCELDWPDRPGPVDYVGGNALYRVEPVREVGGFDAEMRVGEEPELGVRLRASGWRLRHLHTVMAHHHLGIRSLGGYLRRNYRSGVSCALVVKKTGGLLRGYWCARLWRTLGHAALLMAPIALAIPLGAAAPGFAVALASVAPAWLLLLAARKARSLRKRGLTGSLAAAAGFHTYLSKLPAALGILSVIVRGRPARLS